MTPRQYLKKYQYDTRLVTGNFYPSDPLRVAEGDRVGVVLFHPGGPDSAVQVTPFLYNLFMDPALLDLPGGGMLRPWLSRLIAGIRAKAVCKEYEAIGGGSSVNRLAFEQAESLEKLLNRTFGARLGVTFRTYVSMRYWHPFSEETARQMQQDGIDKVVLLSLSPQYSKTTAGSALAYWWRLEQEGEIPSWPTTRVAEYAAHPKYVQAVSERIDEALQRFAKPIRGNVPVLFSAQGTALREMKERGDPYCCLIHATADRVMAYRRQDRPFRVAFHGKVGPAEWLGPSTSDTLVALAEEGHTSVLVVPVALVTEHLETTYALDIALREQAAKTGIRWFEVMPALNCHPLFIEALAEATLAHLTASPARNGKQNGVATTHPSVPITPVTYEVAERCTRCSHCQYVAEAQRWVRRHTVSATPSVSPPTDVPGA